MPYVRKQNKEKNMVNEIKLASKGKRFAAALVDLLIIPFAIGVIIALVGILVEADQLVRTFFLIACNIGWFIFRDTVWAPGREMVGIKLQKVNGDELSDVTVGAAVVRNILLIIPYVLVVGYVVEIISLLVKGHRVADAWASTVVVEK